MLTLIEEIKERFAKICIGEEILYIGGQDVLPAPLSKDEEEELLENICEDNVKSTLIERNLRLVVYIARKFENTGINVEAVITNARAPTKIFFDIFLVFINIFLPSIK